MQDERVHMQKEDNNNVAAGTQQLIEYLGELWQRPHEPSAETLQKITQFADHLEEPYRSMALNTIAEHFVNNLSLRFLEIMATFQEKAEEEGIDVEEVQGTFDDVRESIPTMMNLSKHLSVQSMEKLVKLNNITQGLYGLSRVDSAEDAQRWLYDLPRLCSSRLERENLVPDFQAQFTVSTTLTTMQVKGFASVNISLSNPKAVRTNAAPVASDTVEQARSHLDINQPRPRLAV